MTEWRFVITEIGESDLNRLDAQTKERVKEKLHWFIENFELVTPFPLHNAWKGFFKLRVGDWRVVYEIDYTDHLIIVHLIDKRDKIYKRT